MTTKNRDPRFYVSITRVDEEQRTVEGYASTETVDSYGTVVDLGSIKKCLPAFSAFPSLREMHQAMAAGTIESSTVDDNGLYIVARVVDDAAWEKVKEKVYRGFEIGAKKDYQINDRIFLKSISEISLVDRPSNNDCTIDEFRIYQDTDPIEAIQRIHQAGGISGMEMYYPRK